MHETNGESRGNGYYEHEHGRFDAALVFEGKMIARTNGELIIGYNRLHEAEINEWADEYGYNVEWH